VAAALAPDPARIASVQDEPAVAGGDEPDVGALEWSLGNHAVIIGAGAQTALTPATSFSIESRASPKSIAVFGL
jgi:hypothetical protein